MRIGLSLLNFETPGRPEERFERISRVLVAAESSGVFESIWIGDHLNHSFGGPMLDPFSLLGGLAARTRVLRLGLLVATITLRHPAVIARGALTLDVISRGRFVLGLGAGAIEPEHAAHGIPFPSHRERQERLEEAVTVCRLLFTGRQVDFNGRHYKLDAASMNPPPLQAGGPRIVVGGRSRRTIRIAAEKADGLNLTYPSLGLARDRFRFLETCISAAGRPLATVRKSVMTAMVTGRTAADTDHNAAAFRARRSMDDKTFQETVIFGDRRRVRERVAAFEAEGVDELYVGLPMPYEPGQLEDAAEILSPWAPGR